jgi:pimeloyl-ACP methyl ester carboxylesterase
MLGRALAARGYVFLSGNTRGHDVGNVDLPWPLSMRAETLPQIHLGGNAWFRFEEIAHDVAGWIDYLAGQGIEQVVILGHSFGVKCALAYQAQRQDPRVVGLILLSGSDRVAAEDPGQLELAKALVAEGKGATLLPLAEDAPPFDVMSADLLLDWERLTTPFAAAGHLPWIEGIRTPMLAMVGTLDYIPNLREAIEGMRARATQAPRFDLQVIEGADHAYTDRADEVAQVVLDWLAQLSPAEQFPRRSWWNRR